MLLFENIQLALNGLRANKMRALLTMLGIIIGIGSALVFVVIFFVLPVCEATHAG